MKNVGHHPHLHSFYLNFLADFGVAGGIVFAVMLFLIFKRLWTMSSNTKDSAMRALAYGLFWGFSGVLIGDCFDTLLLGPATAMELFWLIGITFRQSVNKGEKLI